MKTCPFCAEQIQDAAVVCRYCGREQPDRPMPRNLRMSATKPWIIGSVIGAILIAGLVVVVLSQAGAHSNGGTPTHTMHLTVAETSLGGAQNVQVSDASGTVVGTATLQMGSGCLMNGCTASVDIPGLPESSFYTVVVGNNAFPLTTTASLSDLSASGWSVYIRPH